MVDAMLFSIALSVASLFGVLTQSPSQASPGSVAITDVTVIDVVTGRHQAGVTVLTVNDRIAAIAQQINIPREAIRVDGKGKFLIPGLWDMHAHHQGTGTDSLDLFVAKGIVGTRDMGADADFILPLRNASGQARFLVPRLLPPARCWMTLRRGFPTVAV